MCDPVMDGSSIGDAGDYADGLDPHYSHLEDQEGLTASLDDVIGHLPQSVPEGWEVVSHDLTAARSTIILTVLLRRKRGLATAPEIV